MSKIIPIKKEYLEDVGGSEGREPLRLETASPSRALPAHLGYNIIGPLCYGFVRWLVGRAREAGLSHLYFLSRDGWLLKKAFDLLPADVTAGLQSHYLYSSRRAVWFAALEENTSEAEFNEILAGASPYIPVKNFLQRIFIDPREYLAQIKAVGFSSENDVVNTSEDREKLYRLFDIIKPEIVANAKKEREAYLAYLAKEGVLDRNRVGLVDVGWTGSIIKYTRKLVRQVNPSVDIQAYFLGVGNKAHTKYGFTKGTCLHGYLFDFDDTTHAEIRKGFFVVEKFLSPNDPTFIKMERKNGLLTPVFKSGPREASPLNNVVQNFAMQFVKDQGRMGNVLGEFDQQVFLPELKKLLLKPEPDVARFLSRYSYSADFGYQVCPNPIANSGSTSSYLRHPLHLLRDYRRARWKAGFIAQQPAAAQLILKVVQIGRLDKLFDTLLQWKKRWL